MQITRKERSADAALARAQSLSFEAELRLANIAAAIFFCCLAAILAGPVFSHASWLVFVQDDLLYYLKVAQNIAHGQGSTFNGIVPTNGYQPLWLVILVLLSHFTVAPRLILGFLAAADFLAAVATFFLAKDLFRSSGVRPLLLFIFAAWSTLYAVTLFFYGMETTLTVPIMLAVICVLRRLSWLERSPSRTFCFGLLLSAMVLSRIDTLLFGALLLLGMLFFPSLRQLIKPRLLLGLALGLLPIAVYFAVNRHVFHTWMPVSGMAKQLKKGYLPSLEPWRVFFHPLAASYAVLLLFATVLLARIRRGIAPIDRVVFFSALLFPWLYYFVLSCVSDWTLWGWYMYPLRIAVCISCLVLCLSRPLAAFLQKPVVMALLVLTVAAGLARMRWTRQQADIYAASVEIAQFAGTHPGVYAMGDRAGRVAYLLPYPVIQTEGLMMDREFLGNIKREVPLREALERYGVRYYIATAYKPFSGCFEAGEPAKAGPASAHMRAEFCEPPLITFLHDGNETLIFDVMDNSVAR